MFPSSTRARLLLPLLLTLAACQAPTPRTPSPFAASAADDAPFADYAAMSARGASVFVLDNAHSNLRIYTFRGGAGKRFGHNHVLRAARFEGYVALFDNDPGTARFDLRVPLAALVVDEPELRARTGNAFSGERSDSDIAGTRANMLGARGLDADRFPEVRVHATRIAGDWPLLVADMEVSLHGRTQPMQVPLRVHRDATGLRIAGRLALRQSDFAMQPYSALLGLLAVQDPVVVEFELRAEKR